MYLISSTTGSPLALLYSGHFPFYFSNIRLFSYRQGEDCGPELEVPLWTDKVEEKGFLRRTPRPLDVIFSHGPFFPCRRKSLISYLSSVVGRSTGEQGMEVGYPY